MKNFAHLKWKTSENNKTVEIKLDFGFLELEIQTCCDLNKDRYDPKFDYGDHLYKFSKNSRRIKNFKICFTEFA